MEEMTPRDLQNQNKINSLLGIREIKAFKCYWVIVG